MSTLEVEMVDIHEWDAEESPDRREEEKKEIKKMLDRAVIANEGNPGMVKRILKQTHRNTSAMHHLYGILLARCPPNQDKQLTKTKTTGLTEQQIGLPYSKQLKEKVEALKKEKWTEF